MTTSRFRASTFLLLLLVASPAMLLSQADVTDVPVPTLTRYATDMTVTLTANQVVLLNQKLEKFEKETSTQIVVLMIPTVGSAAIEEYALRVAEKNRIGGEGKNNGTLL